MGVLRLLGPDQSTLLFDFTSPTGTGNPNSLVTELSAGVDMGTLQPALRLAVIGAGANIEAVELPPVEASWSFTASAATDDDLWAGLGQLARYLVSIARDHPLYLEWNELGTVYYYDLLGATQLPQLFRGQTTGAVISGRRHSMGPIPVTVMRQPWRRGAAVTTSAEVVEGDPATGTPDQSYLASLTVAGDLPTPLQVRAQMDTGAAVPRVLMAHRYRGSRPSTYLTDYRDETAWAQAEASGRGWTVALSNDTAAAADGALASPASGNVVAQVSGAGSTVALMVRRVRWTRTTLLDSLRGTSIPYVRLRTTAASEWEIQVRWGPSTADPCAIAEDAYRHVTTAAGAFGYVMLPLGRLDLPQAVALSGLAVDLFARRISGSGNLNVDLLWLPPDPVVALAAPAGASFTWLGSELATPVTNPGGTAGTPLGTLLVLDDLTDTAGIPPAGGSVLAAGRYTITWTFSNNEITDRTVRAVVRNVTGSSDTYSATVTCKGNKNTQHTASFDADGTSTYQAQVDDPSITNRIRVVSIRQAFQPALAANESVRTDPGPVRYAVDRLDSSGNLAGYLEAEGPVPLMGMPGDNQVLVVPLELPIVGYSEHEHKLDRDPSVTITYAPRSAL